MLYAFASVIFTRSLFLALFTPVGLVVKQRVTQVTPTLRKCKFTQVTPERSRKSIRCVKRSTKDLTVRAPCENCNPDGIRSGMRMARFGGTWRDSTGFGGIWRKPAFESVALGLQTMCPKEGFCVASDSRPNPFFSLLLCSTGFGLSPLFVNPLFGFCWKKRRHCCEPPS